MAFLIKFTLIYSIIVNNNRYLALAEVAELVDATVSKTVGG